MTMCVLILLLFMSSPIFGESGFSERYESDFNTSNPSNRFHPENHVNQFDPDNPFNPVNKYDPQTLSTQQTGIVQPIFTTPPTRIIQTIR
jgi:hypothetical protein